MIHHRLNRLIENQFPQSQTNAAGMADCCNRHDRSNERSFEVQMAFGDKLVGKGGGWGGGEWEIGERDGVQWRTLSGVKRLGLGEGGGG